MLLNLFKRRKPIFAEQEIAKLKLAIAAAEKSTSGEIRVYIESRCRYVEATDRAAELFLELKMQETVARNGVLIYLATEDRQLAIWGDQGVHERLGNEYWQQRIEEMLNSIKQLDYLSGITYCIEQVGNALSTHFPYQRATDQNELSDEILFGK